MPKPEKHIMNLALKSEVAILSAATISGEHQREAQRMFDQLVDAEIKKFGAAPLIPITKHSLATELGQGLKNAANATHRINRGTHLGINAITTDNLPALVPTAEGSALAAWRAATNCEEISDVRSALADLLASSNAAQLREMIAINQGRLDEALTDGYVTVGTPVGEIRVAFNIGVWPTVPASQNDKQPLFEEFSLPMSSIYGLSIEQLAERNQIIDRVIEVTPENAFDPILNAVTERGGNDDDMIINLNRHSVQLSKATKRDVYKVVRRRRFDTKNNQNIEDVSVIVLPYAIAQTL